MQTGGSAVDQYQRQSIRRVAFIPVMDLHPVDFHKRRRRGRVGGREFGQRFIGMAKKEAY